MTKNPILDELRATRERLLAESGGTVTGLIERLRAEQAASDRPVFNAADNRGTHQTAESGDLPVENQSTPPSDR
jgi:hypothetical protein